MEGELGPGRRRLFAVLTAALVLVAVEGASRAYVAFGYGASWLRPGSIVGCFYPELRKIQQRGTDDGDAFRVLLLGGSVLHPAWGAFPETLHDVLARRSAREVEIYNAAAAGHATRDSLIKYRHLAAERFDLVIVYHGINELRANNVPAADFRGDYSHIAWYRRLAWIEAHPGLMRWSAVPYALHDVWIGIETLVGRYRPIPRIKPDPELLAHGAELKTPASFQQNLEAILALAHERDQPVLLMSYAYYLAPGYSKSAFRQRALDYGSHRVHVEVWGRPEHVVAGLDAHNAVIRDVAARHPEVAYVDQEAAIPDGALYWNDVCHLSVSGMLVFAEGIGRELEARGVLP